MIGTVNDDACKFMISHWILFRMRNVPDKNCRVGRNPHFMFNKYFSENLAFYEIKWKNVVQLDRSQMAV